ncbi:hypothetical protein [Thalassotalea mangrovi]|uniref:FTR1 family iron permease n=1 Tax=Thalassotalea mangrovi TaxID=2572245 RepID=A0A4U1B4X2_9GAMM|nr:hypothetical protein [Thalassotalea mangrovi]TKB45443.1 hypothetical protein E8M12_08485 [Thalassotalea mangrovi]
MLVNTIILFLRDLLPIFILLGIIAVVFKHLTFSLTFVVITLCCASAGVIGYFHLLPALSDAYMGSGIELSQVILILISMVSLLTAYVLSRIESHSRIQKVFLLFAITAFVIVRASAFIIFLDGYLMKQEFTSNIIVGIALGTGICLSLVALLYFLLLWLQASKLAFTVTLLFALFIAGQVAHSSIILHQINLIDSSIRLWDSSPVIRDASEYGHFFKALLGYEARPTLVFALSYLLTVLLILILHWRCRRPAPSIPMATGGTKNAG